MAIRVMLEDHTGNISQEAEIQENVSVERLIRAMIAELKLPIADTAGRPITYHFSHNNRRLQAYESLERQNVQDGDTLFILPMLASSGVNNIIDTSSGLGKSTTEDFDAFFIHNNEDTPRVESIRDRLQELGLLIWFPRDQLRPGLPTIRQMEEQIDKVKSAVVFIGNGTRSSLEDLEVQAFFKRLARRKPECPVIPVILPDCDNEPDLHGFLGLMHHVDFRESNPDPIKHLYWGITGKSLS